MPELNNPFPIPEHMYMECSFAVSVKTIHGMIMVWQHTSHILLRAFAGTHCIMVAIIDQVATILKNRSTIFSTPKLQPSAQVLPSQSLLLLLLVRGNGNSPTM